MRSCKEAGTGCLPPRCRTGVSAARLQVAHLDPLRIAGPRSAQAAPLVTPCLRDHRHRLEGDALVHRPPGSAAYRRPATARAGHRPRRRPGAVPVRQPSRAGESRSAPAGAPSVPGCQDANPARGCRDQQGVPADLTPAAPRDINHSRCFRYPRNIGRTRAVIRIWRRFPLIYSQPVHRLPGSYSARVGLHCGRARLPADAGCARRRVGVVGAAVRRGAMGARLRAGARGRR